jgi:hypothetical protein
MSKQVTGYWDRHEAVMRRCRALERHAASLRGELLRLAGGEGGRRRADRALRALQQELQRAQLLANEFEAVDAADVPRQVA